MLDMRALLMNMMRMMMSIRAGSGSGENDNEVGGAEGDDNGKACMLEDARGISLQPRT